MKHYDMSFFNDIFFVLTGFPELPEYHPMEVCAIRPAMP